MKKIPVIMAITALGALAAPAQGPPGKWWSDPELAKELGLKPEQQSEIDQIHRRDRERIIDLRADIEKKHMALEDALDASSFDENKARTAHSAVQAAESEMRKAEFERQIAVRKALSHEQFRKLGRLLHHGPPGMGPGPGGPHPPMPPRPPHGPEGPPGPPPEPPAEP